MSVLRKRLEVVGSGAAPRGMTLDRALRLAAGRAFRADGGPGVQVAGVTSRACDAESLADVCPGTALLAVLDGAGGQVGAVAMSAPLVHALVGFQLLGTIPKATADGRRVTRVEAALVAPLIDGILSRLVTAWDDDDAARPGWLLDYRFGAMVRDPRALALALAPGGGQLFRLSCVLGEGEAEGEVLFFLPDLPRAEDRQRDEDTRFPDAVRAAPLVMTAILARVSLTLDAAQDLAVGQVLELPPDAAATARLAPRGGGSGLRVKLGKISGMRAVRLLQDVGTDGDAEASGQQPFDGPPGADRATVAPAPASFTGAPVGGDAGNDTQADLLTVSPQPPTSAFASSQ
ncbi:hypothetical protein [Shimia biformata]|uniref:hypothetical protein n=1 Tax=Shimia biformata TaxID=1294299 RepID=UPI00194E7B37|nr:hypothetical protein [Shimia biformata]